ncbi:MAG: hypothetical protein LBF65_01345 [Holosporales bacterium]|jgi:hypothetical protein|nr:hypothetical protein [Holosporales bacterium]
MTSNKKLMATLLMSVMMIGGAKSSDASDASEVVLPLGAALPPGVELPQPGKFAVMVDQVDLLKNICQLGSGTGYISETAEVQCRTLRDLIAGIDSGHVAPKEIKAALEQLRVRIAEIQSTSSAAKFNIFSITWAVDDMPRLPQNTTREEFAQIVRAIKGMFG